MQKSLKTAQEWGRPETFFSGRLRNNKKVAQGRGAPSRAAARVLPWLSMLLLTGTYMTGAIEGLIAAAIAIVVLAVAWILGRPRAVSQQTGAAAL